MKRQNLYLLLLMVFPVMLHSQSAWTRITPTPQENTINCITKIPETNKLIAVTGGSMILISEDQGNSWIIKTNPAGKGNNYSIFTVKFLNSNIGYISGSYESVLKTTDGGLTYEEVYSGGSIYNWAGYYDFAFSESNIGVAVGHSGKILRTSNGGDSWVEVVSGVDFKLNAVDFCLSDRFIAVGSDQNIILISNDCGLTWESQTINTSVTYGSLTDIKFITNTVGFISVDGSENKILRTVDAGENWSTLYSGAYSPKAIDFYDDMHIAISCHREIYESGILLSENNGLSWEEYPLGGFSWGANKSIVVLNELMDLIMAGNLGMMFWSSGGFFWENLHERTFWGDIYQVRFLDENTGFALAKNNTGGMLYSDLKKTVDGGISWNNSGGFWNDNGAFYFLNNYLGFMTFKDFELYVYKTTDGGLTWTEIETGFDFDPRTIKFYGTNNGIIAGEWQIIKTTDTGNTWEEINYTPTFWTEFFDIEFISEEEIFIVGGGDYTTTLMLKSNDSGNSCEEDSVGNYGAAYDICFINENIAFLACSFNMILKSSDGGNSWFETTTNNLNPIQFRSIHFPTQEIGYAVGDGSYETILKTTDGGETWNVINSGTTSGLNCVHFFDNNTGLVFGENGVVLKTTTGGTTGFEEINKIAEKNNLHAYPNPFTNKVTLEFNLPKNEKSGHVFIYDQTCKQILSYPVNHTMKSIEISGDKLKPGIYFYQLKTKNGINETKKMVKIE